MLPIPTNSAPKSNTTLPQISEQDREPTDTELDGSDHPRTVRMADETLSGDDNEEGLAETSGSGSGHSEERVPSTIPEEGGSVLQGPSSDGEAAEEEEEEEVDDLSALPAYQAYLYVLLGAAVARDFLHPRTTASATTSRSGIGSGRTGGKTEQELAEERERKKLLHNSEVRQKGKCILYVSL